MTYNNWHALEILEQTPKTINNLLINLSDNWIYCNEGKDTWSPFDVVGHLIHCENTDWIPRLNIILGDKANKTFEPFDRFAQLENSKGKTIQNLLDEFSESRSQNITYLKSLELTETEFQLKGIHPSFGEVTAKELLATWVTHDLGHIAQIARVIAKQYKDEVGPWIKFIPILNT